MDAIRAVYFLHTSPVLCKFCTPGTPAIKRMELLRQPAQPGIIHSCTHLERMRLDSRRFMSRRAGAMQESAGFMDWHTPCFTAGGTEGTDTGNKQPNASVWGRFTVAGWELVPVWYMFIEVCGMQK